MEKWESFNESLGVWVSEQHTFGADTLLLADYAAHGHIRVCELGCGCGAIALLLAAGGATVDAVEIQPEAADMAARSAAKCGLSAKVRVVTADWRQLQGVLPAGGYDRVVCNPPYFPAGSGKTNESDARRIARHESGPETLGELCGAAARLLKMGGTFCVCHRPERLSDLFAALREHRLEPKQLTLLCHSGRSAPWLVLCAACRGANPGLQVSVSVDR